MIIGLAYRISDLENMPFGMSDMSSTKTVSIASSATSGILIGIYILLLICWILVDQSIDYVIQLIFRTFEDAVAFTKVLRNIYDRHSGVSYFL